LLKIRKNFERNCDLDVITVFFFHFSGPMIFRYWFSDLRQVQGLIGKLLFEGDLIGPAQSLAVTHSTSSGHGRSTQLKAWFWASTISFVEFGLENRQFGLGQEGGNREETPR